MSYSVSDIDTWAKICQPLAARGEAEKKAYHNDQTADEDLHIKIADARASLEWEYSQNPNSDYLYKLKDYVLALCGVYLLEAQQISVDGGIVIIPTTPTSGTSVTMAFYWAYKADFSNATDYTKSVFIGKDIDVFFQNGNRFLENNEYVLLADGTVRVLIDGFDSSLYDTGKKIIRVDINGEAPPSNIEDVFVRDLVALTTITDAPTGVAYQIRRWVIRPNGFGYVWDNNYFEFDDLHPEQPDATGVGTVQIYDFVYDPVSGKNLCSNQIITI